MSQSSSESDVYLLGESGRIAAAAEMSSSESTASMVVEEVVVTGLVVVDLEDLVVALAFLWLRHPLR